MKIRGKDKKELRVATVGIRGTRVWAVTASRPQLLDCNFTCIFPIASVLHLCSIGPPEAAEPDNTCMISATLISNSLASTKQ